MCFSELNVFLMVYCSIKMLHFTYVQRGHFRMSDIVSIHSKRLEHLGIHLGITSKRARMGESCKVCMSFYLLLRVCVNIVYVNGM